MIIRRTILRLVQKLGYDLVPTRVTAAGKQLVLRPLDPVGVEILSDAEFQASCRQIEGLTLLDTPRLANLWELCRLTDPGSSIVEVGTYRGGSALHLANCAPGRPLFIFDSFEGFHHLDAKLDQAFNQEMFRDTSRDNVVRLFAKRQPAPTVVAGFFPASAAGLKLAPVGFVHLDVDTYDSTRDALEFLRPHLASRALIVVDDYHRTAHGVDRALEEFVARHPEWRLLPLFPSQALLIPRSWHGPVTPPAREHP
jgi:predicted O-methyltransferase YrrM